MTVLNNSSGAICFQFCHGFINFSQFNTCVDAEEFSGRVGFLGIGIMGSPMAQNLIKAG